MYSGTQILRKHWYHICTLYRQITWVLVLKSYRERKKTLLLTIIHGRRVDLRLESCM